MRHHVIALTVACAALLLGLAASGQAPTAVPTGLPIGDIVFQSDRDGDFDIYVMDAGGDNVRNLTNNDVPDAGPTLSPAGDKVAYCTLLDGNWDIYVVDINGANPVNLTNSQIDEFQPAWSPDGNWMAFAAGSDEDRDIAVINLTNGKRGLLVDDEAVSERPAWSSDSARIAFQSNANGNGDVYVVGVKEAEGQLQAQETKRLTTAPAADAEPAWSPKGNRIAYRSGNDIHVMDIDEGREDNLTKSDSRDAEPSWCANGDYLVFCSNRDGNDEIYMMMADGTGLVDLTVNPAADQYPCWR